MRILHFADLHLGIENYGTVDPETGLSSRLLDVLRVLDEVVEYAIGNPVDLVLFCGDAYKTRDPSQTQQRELARRIKRLSDAGIPLFMVVGNHDLPNSPGRANALEIFNTLAVDNVYVASKPGITMIETRGGPAQVAALPWLRRAGLLAAEEGRGLTLEQMLQRMQEMLTEAVSRLAGSVDPAVPAVLAAHVGIASARIGSECTMVLGREPVVLASNIALPQFDYVALGHVHRAQKLNDRPPMAYSGSLERVDFGEEGDEKGFYVIELDPLRAQGERCSPPRFHAVSARRFVTIRARVDANAPDPAAGLMQAVAERQSELKGAIVRVEVDVDERAEGQVREADIRRALGEAQSISVTKNVERESRVRLPAQAGEDLTPRRVLELYLDMLDADKMPPERKKKLLEYGEKLIWERGEGQKG